MTTAALLLLCFASCAPFQDPDAQKGALDPVLARLSGDTVITRQQYLEHLYTTFGSARLPDLVLDLQLAREIADLDEQQVGRATRAALADPEGRTRSVLETRIQQEFGGDEAAFRANLQRSGLTMAEVVAATRLATQREDRLTACVQAARTEDPQTLQRLFDHHHGVDGYRVTVRHLFLAFGTVRHEIQDRRPGTRVTETEVERVTRERSVVLRRLLDQGTDFEALVPRSDDRRRPDGTIPDYNFIEYGVELATAVRAIVTKEPPPTLPSAVQGPLRTSHGYHLFQVVSASHTEFTDVKEQLRRLLREAPPTLAERNRMQETLLVKSGFKAKAPR